MGRAVKEITRGNILRYLRARGYPRAEIKDIQPLGQDTDGDLKAFGYGRPLCVSFEESDPAGGRPTPYRLVFRTMSADPFDHNRRSDRARQMLLCFDTFNTIPRHIPAHDIGAFREDGELWSVPNGEFFLVTGYVDGDMYADDLERLVNEDKAPKADIVRAKALATYLAELHQKRHDPSYYARELRETVGSGEGIFGLCDSYPDDHPIATPERLRHIQELAVRWRWELRRYAHRCCRTHGDFHPFNIICRHGTDFSVLDCSRGGQGEAADDLSALSVNYLFVSMHHRGRFEGALRELWDAFWSEYLECTKDQEVLKTAPLYFAWRVLVVCSPLWYPGLKDSLRDCLLGFAERLLEGQPFDPKHPEQLLQL